MSENRKSEPVITGIGAVTPLGIENPSILEKLLKGTSAAGAITVFDPVDLPTRIAAQVDLDTLPFRLRDRKVAFGVSAARFALRDASARGEQIEHYYGNRIDNRPDGSNESARSDARSLNPQRSRYVIPRAAVSFGMGLELFSLPDMIVYLHEEKMPENSAIDPLQFLQTPSDVCPHLISAEMGFQIPPLCHISACAASTDAIGAALGLMEEDLCDLMIVGGADSMINPMGVGGFSLLQAMTRRNDDPARASRPFDSDRDGFLLGEGAAAFMIEKRGNAVDRGAKIYGTIVGFGNSFDAHGISEPHPEGEGALLAMRRALNKARLQGKDISYINAHGTSTPKNDVTEALAINRVFGRHASRIAVSSTKSMVGHCISASGAVELAAVLLCGERGLIHPGINLDHPDPECDLNFVVGQPERLGGPFIMKNSFAFGGQNSSLIIRIES